MKAEEIRKVALLGAGMIGNGLALHFAKAGYDVALYSRTQQTLDRALDSIRATLPQLLEGSANTTGEIDRIAARVRTTTSLDAAISGAPIIIESVAEDLKIKQDLFKQLDERCPMDVILATNTSVISIGEIASKSKNRNRIVGTHFWFPPYLIPLVEVVKGRDTSDETMELTYQFMKLAGKHPIKCLKDVPGFVANRLQHALVREAISIVERGIADGPTVDEALKNSFGMRIAMLGPIEGCDSAGLDLVLKIHNVVLKDLESSPNPSPLLKAKVEKGELGFKSGKGFYESWTPDKIKSLRVNLNKYLMEMVKRQQNP